MSIPDYIAGMLVFKKGADLGTGEVAQELRVLAALVEDLSSIPNTLIGHLTPPVTPVPGNTMPFSWISKHM